ncbi:hypothetical protein [Methylobacterium sp. Leaf466]|uniref:hypothetical protein n=1 Tax=Methylobacterium sp. Leaf466 TaxID=1736386 RepID=UPI0006FB3A93|nr:hypothetical protein [Methylobacterium sp. Leaf466]KQT77973.1 hypothetical protein ASG59_11760 [Methylobacterium sp. Leaf466]
MYSCRITLPEFADIHDRMAVTDRKIVDGLTVTTGICRGLGQVIVIQLDQGAMLLSDTRFDPPGYNAGTAIYRDPGSPLSSAYNWN